MRIFFVCVKRVVFSNHNSYVQIKIELFLERQDIATNKITAFKIHTSSRKYCTLAKKTKVEINK